MVTFKTKRSFGEQLSDIQSIFQTAKTKAKALADAMATEKTNKEAQITKLNEEINAISEVEARNNAFIETLDKFVQ